MAVVARVLEESYHGITALGADVSEQDVVGLFRRYTTGNVTEATDVISAFDDGALIPTPCRRVRARTANQSRYIALMRRFPMVFAQGPAGCGKTYLSVAYAASLLSRGDVQRIVLSRPLVEAGERLGFLPGDIKEKVDPYLRPLYDSLNDVLSHAKVAKYMERGLIEIAPLAFMRGRSVTHSFIILDEAQNTTPAQMKMFLTRLGEGSRMVIAGDPGQSDVSAAGHSVRSGLLDAFDVLSTVKDIGFLRFSRQDVVRHPLVERIVEAYEKKE
ncbi:MAG: PhoH family protein [Alphaproteobacteria bacterium GM202ARS2]|nr:PhoH family protein [Alphaproteobacteria bacterium GM202ARS2]